MLIAILLSISSNEKELPSYKSEVNKHRVAGRYRAAQKELKPYKITSLSYRSTHVRLFMSILNQ